MEKHVTLVAVLCIAFGIMGVLFSAFLLVVIVGAGIISGDPEAIAITSIVGPAVAGVIFLMSVPDIIGGIGLLKRKGWARILVLILACMDLVQIPIGTIIGIYVLWVLLQDETAEIFKKKQV